MYGTDIEKKAFLGYLKAIRPMAKAFRIARHMMPNMKAVRWAASRPGIMSGLGRAGYTTSRLRNYAQKTHGLIGSVVGFDVASRIYNNLRGNTMTAKDIEKALKQHKSQANKKLLIGAGAGLAAGALGAYGIHKLFGKKAGFISRTGKIGKGVGRFAGGMAAYMAVDALYQKLVGKPVLKSDMKNLIKKVDMPKKANIFSALKIPTKPTKNKLDFSKLKGPAIGAGATLAAVLIAAKLGKFPAGRASKLFGNQRHSILQQTRRLRQQLASARSTGSLKGIAGIGGGFLLGRTIYNKKTKK